MPVARPIISEFLKHYPSTKVINREDLWSAQGQMDRAGTALFVALACKVLGPTLEVPHERDSETRGSLRRKKTRRDAPAIVGGSRLRTGSGSSPGKNESPDVASMMGKDTTAMLAAPFTVKMSRADFVPINKKTSHRLSDWFS